MINMETYVKWLCIVFLNGSIAFLFTFPNSNAGFQIGIVSGMISWWLAYAFLDSFLIKTGRTKQSNRLMVCALLRAPIQLFVAVDMFAGVMADETLKFMGFISKFESFLDGYLLTVFTGMYLSFICAFIYAILAAIAGIRNVEKSS